MLFIITKKISWRKNVHTICWFANETHNENLMEWVVMQRIKEASTLRKVKICFKGNGMLALGNS